MRYEPDTNLEGDCVPERESDGDAGDGGLRYVKDALHVVLPLSLRDDVSDALRDRSSNAKLTDHDEERECDSGAVCDLDIDFVSVGDADGGSADMLPDRLSDAVPDLVALGTAVTRRRPYHDNPNTAFLIITRPCYSRTSTQHVSARIVATEGRRVRPAPPTATSGKCPQKCKLTTSHRRCSRTAQALAAGRRGTHCS